MGVIIKSMLKEFFLEKKELLKKIIFDYGKVFYFVFTLLLIFALFYFIFHISQNRELKVVFFDVGQGDAIFIETPGGKQVLIDGGPNNLILNRLSREMNFFDKEIDVVIATHYDSDHITGLIPVFEKYNIENIVITQVKGSTNIFDDFEKSKEREELGGAKVYFGKKGDVVDFSDGTILYILYPYTKNIPDNKTNENSISVLLKYKDKTFLLTGDLPIKNEKFLLDENILPKNITVYKAGHHGSKTSSGEQLLSYIKPYYSIISAGKDNKYGHPNIETTERLKKYSKVILSTIDLGSIEFITNGDEFKFGTK